VHIVLKRNEDLVLKILETRRADIEEESIDQEDFRGTEEENIPLGCCQWTPLEQKSPS
jgi:hypothetical protein